MDERAEKLAKARKKLRDHQEKKSIASHKCEVTAYTSETPMVQESINHNVHSTDNIKVDHSSTTNGETEDLYLNKNLNDNNVKSDINVTEILISNRTNLESQIIDLNGKLAHLEHIHSLEVMNHNICKQKVTSLQFDLTDVSTKLSTALEEITFKNEYIKQINTLNQSLKDENNNLSEQIEFTKSMLTSKEFENAQLQNQIFSNQNQLDLLQLQIQQLTNDSPVNIKQENKASEENNGLLQNIHRLEHKIEALQKERDSIQSHYEHYVHELNEQLKSEMFKSENLAKDLENLYNRENSLVEQISDMEIRLQNYDIKSKTEMSNENVESTMEKDYQEIKTQLEQVTSNYNQLQIQYTEALKKIEILQQHKDNISSNEMTCNHDNVDITKLSADITSDKIAAQRATEQNKKLKLNIEELEQIIVKMGKDKLELTEKWTHEKQLNKGLALKLAEVEENQKYLENKLKAKDDEMIRLQNEYRTKEETFEKHLHDAKEVKSNLDPTSIHEVELSNDKNHNHVEHTSECTENFPIMSPPEVSIDSSTKSSNEIRIQKEVAMIKLQERFLNIMDEVANLSDEKHRLEHIILQLQNETDTICEYVALYQQQRSLLKKREEERSNQLKIFQTERDKLEKHLDELSNLLLRLATDEQLAPYFKQESRHNDLVRVKELLHKLQNCLLINPKFKNFDLNVFYPCGCCSGQLIDI